MEQKRRSGSERIHKAVGGKKDSVGEDDARHEKALLAKRRRRGDKLKCFCDHVGERLGTDRAKDHLFTLPAPSAPPTT